jgi:hypothetical protein
MERKTLEELSILLIDIPGIWVDTAENSIPRALQHISQRNLGQAGRPGKDIEPMGKKLYPTDTLKQAQSILSAWEHIDPALKIVALTFEGITENVATVREMQKKIVHLQKELLDIRNQRDAAAIGLWNKVKRTRSGIKGIYGDDSTEYELAGGTRRSERKKPRRNPLPDSTK